MAAILVDDRIIYPECCFKCGVLKEPKAIELQGKENGGQVTQVGTTLFTQSFHANVTVGNHLHGTGILLQYNDSQGKLVMQEANDIVAWEVIKIVSQSGEKKGIRLRFVVRFWDVPKKEWWHWVVVVQVHNNRESIRGLKTVCRSHAFPGENKVEDWWRGRM